MTVKELHAAIKEATQSINQRLIEYYESGTPNKLVDKEIAYLKTVTGTSERRPYLAMRTHRKNKAELQAQLSELQYFNEWDVFTPEGRRQRKQRELRAWRSYKRNSGSSLHYETWRKMVNIIGTIGKDILQQFGGSYGNKIEEAVRKGRKPGAIVRAMKEVVNENKGAGKSDTDYLDDLIKKLDLTV